MKKLIFGVVLILVILIGCDIENPASPDETNPRVWVTYPGNWDSIYEDEIVLSFEIIESNIDSVFVYLNGVIITSSLQDPYQITINSNDYEYGLQTLYCKAVDKNGNIGISPLINFYWMEEENQGNPTVIVAYPGNWDSIYEEEIILNFEVLGEHEIDSVFVYLNGENLTTFTE